MPVAVPLHRYTAPVVSKAVQLYTCDMTHSVACGVFPSSLCTTKLAQLYLLYSYRTELALQAYLHLDLYSTLQAKALHP